MIEKLPRSSGASLGFRAVGDVTAADYEVMQPLVQEAVDAHGSVRLLLDLREFHWEKVEAWGADLRFGRQFKDSIERLAILGDRTWEKWLARLAEPFYARESKYFSDEDEAWDWVQ